MGKYYFVPSNLYRYYKTLLNVETNDLVALFRDNKIRFSRPNFNDPFDCKINIDFKKVKEKDIAMFAESLAITRSHWPGYDFNSEKQKIIRSFSNSNIKERIQESILECGLFCLSELWNSILMWSHYGDAHKGVCVCFDLADYFDCNIFPVTYQKNYSNYKFGPNIGDFVQRVLLTKSYDWKYEKEHRVIDSQISMHPMNQRVIDRKRIKGVFLGCNISPEDRTKLIAILKETEFKGWLRQIKISKSEFKLYYQDLKLEKI